MATVETTRESERGIVDVETIRYSNQKANRGPNWSQRYPKRAQKRLEASHELAKIEQDLKESLLNPSPWIKLELPKPAWEFFIGIK